MNIYATPGYPHGNFTANLLHVSVAASTASSIAYAATICVNGSTRGARASSFQAPTPSLASPSSFVGCLDFAVAGSKCISSRANIEPEQDKLTELEKAKLTKFRTSQGNEYG